jgi:1,4-alpha-glucan branching enzyme
MGYRDYMGLATEILERVGKCEEDPAAVPHEGNGKSKFGPKKVAGGVLFQLAAPGAKEVFIAGDFNQWVAEPLLRREGSDVWQRVMALPPGGYHYKFLVDGEWRLDPAAPLQKENFYGKQDSFIEHNGVH